MSDKRQRTGSVHGSTATVYRADIDGLRAVAILGVLAYHFGLGVSGGYGGVDVFFVISGFLIAGIIKAELSAGTFSLADFYVRRIRRILPALAACLFVTTIAASFILFPIDFKNYGRSLAAVATATSNFFFARGFADYFASDATEIPLLHTWSLSIEEQFYAVFPLVVMLLFRHARALIVPFMGIVAAASLAYGMRSVAQEPGIAFFSTGGRIWELLSGTTLAFVALSPFSGRTTREAEAVLGTGMIAWSYISYSSATPFPGLAAVPLCLGAVLIIHSGTSVSADTQTTTMIGRLLSSPPAVAIGKISYSVYLWHWPLMVFAHYRFPNFMNTGTGADIASRLLLAAASLIVGALSWRFVERPFRGGTASQEKWQTLATGLATFLVVFGSAKLVSAHAPWFQSWPQEVVKLAKLGQKPPHPSSFGRQALPEQGWPADSYIIGKSGAVHTLMWGDSHAEAILPGLSNFLDRTGQGAVVAARPGCPPIVNVSFYGDLLKKNCKRDNDRVFSALASPAVKRVVLVSRWKSAADQLHYDQNGHAVSIRGDKSVASHDFGPIFKASVEALLDLGKEVLIVGPIPEPSFDVPGMTARNIAWGVPLPAEQTRQQFLQDEERVLSPLAELSHRDGVRVVYPHLVLCDDRSCRYQKAGELLYLDGNHLSAAGARELDSIYAAFFSPANNDQQKHTDAEISPLTETAAKLGP